MPRSGTLVICVQNLDFSGANQVVLNVVSGRVHQSNVVVLSPKIGTFAARFVDSGAAVRVGDLEDLLNEIRDVFCIICNTIMTAPIVVEMSNRVHPVVWILHEWWDDEMIVENLKIRNYDNLTLDTVKQALAKASMIVFVCEAQRQLYNPSAPSTVIFVGVPDPLPRHIKTDSVKGLIPATKSEVDLMNRDPEVFTFLCLGIICPRKNQLWTVQLFKQFAKDKPNVRLKVVGARYTRSYEIEYLELVRTEIGNDPRIELLDVTDNVDPYYQVADALILTSLNEVTPMVISEAMSWSIPVLSTNIAGIGEMFVDGQEGYLFAPGDDAKALQGMESVCSNKSLRQKMAVKARVRFERTFELDLMVESYRQLMINVAPPVILLDMDGVLVDWDKGFMQVWKDRCGVDRARSYYMEDCVLDPSYRKEALATFKAKGFFENLEPMEGALKAIHEMESEGLQLYLCTSPVKGSVYCAQEKLNWIVEHLGEEWLDKAILCQDKTTVVGDLLIDDKPFDHLYPHGKHSAATWKQVVFDAPYNQNVTTPRLSHWNQWRSVILPLVGKNLHHPLHSDLAGSNSDGGTPTSAHTSNSNGDYCDMLGPLNQLKLDVQSRGRTRATSDALLAGFQLPHMDFPHVTRPIGMLKLKRDTSGGSDTHSAHSNMSQHHQHQHSKTSAQIQRDVDMYHSRVECLSPEDIATIRSGSVSFMDDDCDLRSDVSAGGGHPVQRLNSGSGQPGQINASATTNLPAGIASLDAVGSETEEMPTNDTTSSSTDSNVASTAATAGEATSLRQLEHQKQVEEADRKAALEGSSADSYRFWDRIPRFGMNTSRTNSSSSKGNGGGKAGAMK